ncbi:hypothetical protein FRC09_019213 [Ceratobasidium sp. 395]|nr:hypothetical protein FRC09_019213 [Ceratobasidium sp. 395]
MVQPDNRLLTNLIKCEKEHHSALLALLVRSHTSLAALSAYASTAAPPVAQALLGCIQAFAAADEGLRGYAAALEGWKEELKEVRRVEDEVKAVVRDKDILVGRLIKASKQKIPTSSLQAGPAPIPNASYLAPSSPSSSSFSLPSTSQPYAQGGYTYTPTPHATQHINSKLALAQRELHACEAHLASKEAELAEVRRSAMTEGMARRCRAMADVGVVWRERGEQGLGALNELGRDAAGAPPPPPHTYNPPRRSTSYSSHSGSSIAPSHSASQYQYQHPRAQSPFGLPRSTSPFNAGSPGTYQTLSGGYQHSHPLPSLPERDSWHGEADRGRPATYHQSSDERRPMSMVQDDRRPMSMHADERRPVSSLELRMDTVALDLPPPHSIGDLPSEFIPLGRPVSAMSKQGGPGSGGSRWGDDSSDEGDETFKVVENDRWGGRRAEGEGGYQEEEIDPEILRAVEKMGMVVPPKDKPKPPPTPPATASPTSSPNKLPDLKVIEATPQKGGSGKVKGKRKGTKKRERGEGVPVPAPAPIPVPGAPASTTVSAPAPAPVVVAPVPAPFVASAPAPVTSTPAAIEEPKPVPTPTSSAATPVPAARSLAPVPMPVATPSSTLSAPDVTAPAPQPSSPRPIQPASPAPQIPLSILQPASPFLTLGSPALQPTSPSLHPAHPAPEPEPDTHTIGSAAHETHDVTPTSPVHNKPGLGLDLDTDDLGSTFAATTDNEAAPVSPVAVTSLVPLPDTTTVLDNTPKPVLMDMTPRPAMATIAPAPPPAHAPVPAPAPVRVPTPVSSKTKSKHRMTASASEPLVRNSSSATKSKRGTVIESAGETSGTERGTRKKSTKKKSARPAQEDRADLAAMLRDSDGSAPHVRFPAGKSNTGGTGAGAGLYVATAPPIPKPVGTLFLPSTGGGGGTTRSDVGPARTNHFDVVPPSPVVSASRGRSGSGSTSFFGRVAGLFGRKKHSGDGFGSSSGATSAAWKTRTDAHLSRTRDDSSSDEHAGNLVSVTNVTTPAGRLAAIDNPTPSSPRTGLGRKLTKADRGQSLRVGPPESPVRARKTSLTDKEERFEPASPGKKTKSRKTQSQSVDGGGLSRKGSLKSTTSEPVGGSTRRGVPANNLMSLVEGSNPAAGLVLPSALESARRSASPARSQTLSVTPARAVSPARTAAPRPVRATSPMPLKSAMRNTTPSPMPHVASPISPVHITSPTHITSPPHVTSPAPIASPQLHAPSPVIASPSPRNSVAESVYETGEEDFEDASDGEGNSDVTAAGQAPPTPKAFIAPPIPVPTTTIPPTSPGTALAAFKDTISGPLSDATATASVSTTQPARRKSVRINPAPPEMSATPSGTPAMELDEEPRWAEKAQERGGWRSRIGRGWEDSSEESGEDSEYEKVRKALASSYKHMDAVNGVGGSNGKGKEKDRAGRR